MTYQFPPELHPLRDWLKGKGVDVQSIKTDRQALFFARKLSGRAVRFPKPGKSCFPKLQEVQQKLVPEPKRATSPKATSAEDEYRFGKLGAASPVRQVSFAEHAARLGVGVSQRDPEPPKPSPREPVTRAEVKAKRGKASQPKLPRSVTTSATDFDTGLVIFCDGGCEPNPGVGGWGFVVYRDGVEIHAQHGGEAKATNNKMELTGALMALQWFAERGLVEPVRLLCDSTYVVDGANDWRHGWKKKGWRLGVKKELANADLWRELDVALSLVPIKLEWVRGHVGTAGNERADELAAIGRDSVLEQILDAQRDRDSLGYASRSRATSW